MQTLTSKLLTNRSQIPTMASTGIIIFVSMVCLLQSATAAPTSDFSEKLDTAASSYVGYGYPLLDVGYPYYSGIYPHSYSLGYYGYPRIYSYGLHGGYW